MLLPILWLLPPKRPPSKVAKSVTWFVLMAVLRKGRCACSEDLERPFYKTKPCSRSTTKVLAQGRFDSLTGCVNLARRSNGFAFNFSPNGPKNGYFNCYVLQCPETDGSGNFIADEDFDYYSSFGDPQALESTICLHPLGLYRVFTNGTSFDNAILECQKSGGDLADVLSESKTNALADMLKAEMEGFFKMAWVGLEGRNGDFVSSNGDPIDCFKFRAWSPGHPRKKGDKRVCVVLEDTRMWKVADCRRKFAFVCDIYPQRPDRVVDGCFE